MYRWFAVFSDHSFFSSFVLSFAIVCSFVRWVVFVSLVICYASRATQNSWFALPELVAGVKTSRLPSVDKAGSTWTVLFTWRWRKFPRQSHFLSSYRQQHWRFKTSLSQHLSWKEVYRAMFLSSIGHLGQEDLERERKIRKQKTKLRSVQINCSDHAFFNIRLRRFKLGNLHCSWFSRVQLDFCIVKPFLS